MEDVSRKERRRIDGLMTNTVEKYIQFKSYEKLQSIRPRQKGPNDILPRLCKEDKSFI